MLNIKSIELLNYYMFYYNNLAILFFIIKLKIYKKVCHFLERLVN